MKIIPIGISNLNNIPQMLREMANRMENDEEYAADKALLITENNEGNIYVYGYGYTSDRTTIVGMLHRAANQVCGD